MKVVVKILYLSLFLLVITIACYYLVFPELFQWKLEMVLGRENIECRSYSFLEDRTDEIAQELESNFSGLPLEDRIVMSREMVEDYYENLLISENFTVSSFLKLFSLSSTLASADIAYSVLKEHIPPTEPKECYPMKLNENVASDLLSSSFSLAVLGFAALNLSTTSQKVLSDCINVTSERICVSQFINKLENVARKRKAELSYPEETNLPRCPHTIFYLDVKQLEKDLWERLNHTRNPVVVILESLLLSVCEKCASQLYAEFVSLHSCPLIPMNRLDSTSLVIKASAKFTECSYSSLKEQLSVLTEELKMT